MFYCPMQTKMMLQPYDEFYYQSWCNLAAAFILSAKNKALCWNLLHYQHEIKQISDSCRERYGHSLDISGMLYHQVIPANWTLIKAYYRDINMKKVTFKINMVEAAWPHFANVVAEWSRDFTPYNLFYIPNLRDRHIYPAETSISFQ